MIEQRQVNMAATSNAELFSTDATTGFASKLRVIEADADVAMGLLATDTNVTVQIFSGTRLVFDGPVSGGGTAGVFPTIPDNIQVEFEALEGEELSAQLTNSGAGTPSVMAIIQVEEA